MIYYYEIIITIDRRMRRGLWAAALFILMTPSRLWADVGADQSFVAGQGERVYAQTFHRQSVFGEAAPSAEGAKDDWRFHKGIKVSSAYDSNLFQSRTDPKDDQVYNYQPYVGFSRRGNYHYVESFYHFSYLDYVENHKLSYLSQMSTVKMEYHKNKWKFAFNNRYRPEVFIATGERTELAAEGSSSGRVNPETDDASLEADYAITPKTSLNLMYEYGMLYFPKKGNSNSTLKFGEQRHAITPKINYALSPKTKLFASYRLEGDYAKDGQYSTRKYVPTVGVSGRLSPKTAVDFSLGWKQNDFLERGHPTIHGFIYKAAVSRKLTEKIAATASILKDFSSDYVTASGQSPKVKTMYYGLNLSYAYSRTLAFSVGGGYTILSQKGLLAQRDIENPTLTFMREREDQRFDWSVGTQWTPSIGKNLLLEYKSTKKNASFKDSEYDEHTVLGTAEFMF